MSNSIQIRTPFFVMTIVTALVVGFLAGSIYFREQHSPQPTAATRFPQTPVNTPTSGEAGSGNLPAGHPPLNPETTIKLYKEEIAQAPNDPAPIIKLGNYLFDIQRYSEAIEWYEKALKLDPQNVDVQTDLGTSYYYSGNPDEALRRFAASLKINPRHSQTLYNVFIVRLLGKKDLPGAREAMKQFEAIDPQNAALEKMRDLFRKAEANPKAL